MSYDAPQVDRLDLVRQVLFLLSTGELDVAAIAAAAGMTARYVRYSVAACKLLNLVDESLVVTGCGAKLLATQAGSEGERAEFLRCIETSERSAAFRDAILRNESPTREEIAQELIESTDMAMSTAVRRAQTVLAWRRYLHGILDEDRQLSFPQLRPKKEAEQEALPDQLVAPEADVWPMSDASR